MTTLYRPVLIESAEQAEALPTGTVAVRDGALPRLLVVDATGPHWLTGTRAPGYVHPTDMIGWTALVPIEAEEETSVAVSASGFRDIAAHPYSEASMDSDGNVWFGEGLSRVDVTEQFNEWAKQHARTRLVTPWEDA